MSRTRRGIAAATLTLLTLAGCSAEPEPAQVTAVIATPPPATFIPEAAPTPDAAGTPAAPQNQISIDTEQTGRTAAAAAAAITFMRAYAPPKLTKAAWQARVNPLLTDSAREAAQNINLASITAHTVTSSATVLPGADKDARTVTVPTDAGDYTLFLRWDALGGRWLVQTYQPPEIHED
ncbi:MAG: hypothetical protein L0H79_20570 [Intrasporangium sp.]|uniref:hypothetical protein n=1 Tax=Intrasporangium sp. TaxID=1925024 RepID=UPI002647617E|nr:hypothetical protein [Intrasporangium sp.]MDN5798121.1 hypothetical protein [Intrasporangium sp.]